MKAVGVVEIAAGIVVAVKPKYGAFVVFGHLVDGYYSESDKYRIL